MKSAYLLIDVLTLAGPLALSFDKKVAFIKHWKAFVPAILVTSALYVLWDIVFTRLGIWRFNEAYVLGEYFVNLPLEELLFFVAVPYACLFIYACLRTYFPVIAHQNYLRIIAALVFMGCVVALFAGYNKLYTAVTALLLLMTLIYELFFFKGKFLPHLMLTWLVSIVPMAIVNGLLTSLPVLIYNNTENLGLRIHTLPISQNKYGIPIEDFFYNLLYITLMVMIYEHFLNKKKVRLSDLGKLPD